MITVTTGGQETIFIRTQRSDLTPFITYVASENKFSLKKNFHWFVGPDEQAAYFS